MIELLNTDCMEYMAKQPDNIIDLTVTSPPYDNLRKYNNSLEWGEHIWKPIIQELYRITKEGGVVVWVVGDATINGSESGTSFKQALWSMECGFNLHDTMIYAKKNPVPLTHNRYEQQFEYMFVFSKGRPKTFNPISVACNGIGTYNNHKSEKQNEDSYSMRKLDKKVMVKDTKYDTNIWEFTTGTTDKVKHNAPFPEYLASKHILSWSNKFDLIFDPFLGSGTTGKMAVRLNRNFIGTEKDITYYEEGCVRIKNEAKQGKLF